MDHCPKLHSLKCMHVLWSMSLLNESNNVGGKIKLKDRNLHCLDSTWLSCECKQCELWCFSFLLTTDNHLTMQLFPFVQYARLHAYHPSHSNSYLHVSLLMHPPTRHLLTTNSHSSSPTHSIPPKKKQFQGTVSIIILESLSFHPIPCCNTRFRHMSCTFHHSLKGACLQFYSYLSVRSSTNVLDICWTCYNYIPFPYDWI